MAWNWKRKLKQLNSALQTAAEVGAAVSTGGAAGLARKLADRRGLAPMLEVARFVYDARDLFAVIRAARRDGRVTDAEWDQIDELLDALQRQARRLPRIL